MFGAEKCTDPAAMAHGVCLSEIIKVVKGIHTDVLLRAKLVDPNACVSIVTGNKCSLNF